MMFDYTIIRNGEEWSNRSASSMLEVQEVVRTLNANDPASFYRYIVTRDGRA
jgi:hypothetical protein